MSYFFEKGGSTDVELFFYFMAVEKLEDKIVKFQSKNKFDDNIKLSDFLASYQKDNNLDYLYENYAIIQFFSLTEKDIVKLPTVANLVQVYNELSRVRYDTKPVNELYLFPREFIICMYGFLNRHDGTFTKKRLMLGSVYECFPDDTKIKADECLANLFNSAMLSKNIKEGKL